MGIYDREYYRRESPSVWTSLHGRVCNWLVGINFVMFVLQLVTQERVYVPLPMGVELPPGFESAYRDAAPLGPGPFTEALQLDAPAVVHGQVWRLLTYAFLHDTGFPPWHIVINMLVLWYFGSDVEDIYGPKEFLSTYLASAILGGISFVVFSYLGMPGKLCIGASGAVMTMFVLCALHFPHRVIMVMFVLPVPIMLAIVLFLAFDTYSFIMGLVHHERTSGTAVTVHLAGAAFGYLYYKRGWRVSNLWIVNLFSGLQSLPRQRARPRLRVYREEEALSEHAPVSAPPDSDVDEQLEAKLDAVLEKVTRTGQESLSDVERQILLRASEIYRKRRT